MRQRCTARRVRVKVCGVTTVADGRLAADAGVDAVGLNFHSASPRAVGVETAAAIAAALPPFVAAVGVFVDPPAARVAAVLAAVRLDWLQFHGSEPASFCRSFGRPYIKATGMPGGFGFSAFAERYADARALLLDAYDPVRKGGTGATFDWRSWPQSERTLILAGGLTPDNVADAVAAARPFAVDVASGVEGRQPGRKDAGRLARFVEAVANA